MDPRVLYCEPPPVGLFTMTSFKNKLVLKGTEQLKMIRSHVILSSEEQKQDTYNAALSHTSAPYYLYAMCKQ